MNSINILDANFQSRSRKFSGYKIYVFNEIYFKTGVTTSIKNKPFPFVIIEDNYLIIS